jgi:hypothetical protein
VAVYSHLANNIELAAAHSPEIVLSFYAGIFILCGRGKGDFTDMHRPFIELITQDNWPPSVARGGFRPSGSRMEYHIYMEAGSQPPFSPLFLFSDESGTTHRGDATAGHRLSPSNSASEYYFGVTRSNANSSLLP